DGETLRLCLNDADPKQRPTEFRSEAGSNLILFTLKRDKTAASKDQEALQGRWRLVAADEEGRGDKKDNLKEIVLEIKDHSFTLLRPVGAKLEAMMVPDPTRTPKSLDLKIAGGPSAGKTLEAIYEISGDQLKLCWNEQTLARPGVFKSAKGGPSVLTFQREK